MLVLSRKESESILIGDNIRITIIAAADGRARLGIEAPRHVHILREELSRDAYRDVSTCDVSTCDVSARDGVGSAGAARETQPAAPADTTPVSSFPAATPALAPRIARPEPAPSRLPLGNMLAAVMASGALGTTSAG